MESLCHRLDALQEEQMDLLEQDTCDIEDICKYLGLLRKEAVILCAANKKGIKKLGLTVVPRQQVCEVKAKQAIQLHLMVTSLKDSQYGKEKWLFSDLTHDMLREKPRDTFKKNGETVTVYFGGCVENCMEYTMWGRLYQPLEGGGWTTTTSGVDRDGIYMLAEGSKVYYTSFACEAEKYCCKGEWRVVHRGKDITDCEIVSSTTCGPGNDPRQHTPVSACFGGPEDIPDRAICTESRGFKRSAQHLPVSENPDSESPSSPQSTDTGGPHHLTATNTCERQHLERGGGDTCHGEPDSVPSKRPRTESHIPTLLITGGANQLKCLRFRLKKHHRRAYQRCSTTWCWVSEDGLTRCGEHRIFLSFLSEEQRQAFEDTIPLPKGAKLFRVTLPC